MYIPCRVFFPTHCAQSHVLSAHPPPHFHMSKPYPLALTFICASVTFSFPDHHREAVCPENSAHSRSTFHVSTGTSPLSQTASYAPCPQWVLRKISGRLIGWHWDYWKPTDGHMSVLKQSVYNSDETLRISAWMWCPYSAGSKQPAASAVLPSEAQTLLCCS